MRLLLKLPTNMQMASLQVLRKTQPLLQGARGAVHRYFAWKHSWKTTSASLVLVFVAGMLCWNVLSTSASTATLVPNGDVTSAWTTLGGTSDSSCAAGTYCDYVDEGTSDNTSDYLSTGVSSTASLTEEHAMNSPTDVSTATQIVLRVYAMSTTNANGGTQDTLSINIRIGGTLQTASTCTPAFNTWTACTATFTGSWTQANIDSLQVEYLRNLSGTGSASAKADVIEVANVYATLTYTSTIQFNQSAYRWFNNQDASAGGSGTFASRSDYTAGTNPQSVAAADFNGDGKQDMAVANTGSDTVSVFIGSGAGTFATKVDYTTGSAPASVTAADFNGDSKIDLAVTNSNSNTVSVFIGSGTGTFATKVDYTTGGSPNSVIAADFNGDSKQDLAVANYGSATVSVFIGSGTGTFATKVDYTTGTNPQAVTAADFSGDGKIDLATANYGSATVSVFIGSGTGTFATKVDYTTGTNPYSVTAADFNGDSKQDLAVANNGSNTVSVFIGSGTGTFATKVDYATGNAPKSVIAADFNGDGKIDLATANYLAYTVSVFIGSGTGTFATKVDYATDSGPQSVIAADFNGDNVPDLATANYVAGTVSVPLGNANPIDVNTSPQLAAAQDTPVVAPSEGTIFRLRLDIHLSGSQLSAGVGQFKLRYALKGGSATCSVVSGASYNDVSDSSTGIRFADNVNAGSGAGLVANGSDPVHSSDSNILESYQEKGTTTFTNPATVSVGQDGMWDFGLVANHAISGDTYCFKVVDGTGADLNTYTVYPELTIPTATLTQAAYRWYGPAASASTFAKAYGGTSPDVGQAIAQTSDGGYVATGYTVSFGTSGSQDAFIAKYDSSGGLTWMKTLGGSGAEAGNAIAPTSDGGYIVAGDTNSYGDTTFLDAFIAKYDSSGGLTWMKTLAGTVNNEHAGSVAQTTDGGYAIAGYTEAYGGGSRDALTAKFTSSGSFSWMKTLGGANTDNANGIVATSDGGYAITGFTNSYVDTLSGDAFIAKYDSSGGLTWMKTLGGTSTDVGYGIVVSSGGGYAITGTTGSFGAGSNDSFIAKYDSSGGLTWMKTLGGTSTDNSLAITQLTGGSYTIAGYENSYTSGSYDLFTAQFSSSGAFMNMNRIGKTGTGSEQANGVSPTSDGGYVIAAQGTDYGTGGGANDVIVAKYDSSGVVQGCPATTCNTVSTPTVKASGTDFTPTAKASGTDFTPTAKASGTDFTPTISASGTNFTPNVKASGTDFTVTTTVIVATPAGIGTPLAAVNVPYDMTSTTPLTLRIDIAVNNSGIATSGQSFKLRFGVLGGAASCSAVTTYNDVTTTSTLKYYDDPSHASGDAISDDPNNPTDGGRQIVPETYQESNNFTNSASAVYAGQDGMWQFSLAINSSTLKGSDLCIRVETSAGSQLSAYTNYGEVSYSPQMKLLMNSGKWFSRSGIKQNLVL